MNDQENIVTGIEIKLDDGDRYSVSITKRFSPEYGGGEATIAIGRYFRIHDAARAAMSAVTVTKAYREDFVRSVGEGE